LHQNCSATVQSLLAKKDKGTAMLRRRKLFALMDMVSQRESAVRNQSLVVKLGSLAGLKEEVFWVDTPEEYPRFRISLFIQ
jgi:hypothetical protein